LPPDAALILPELVAGLDESGHPAGPARPTSHPAGRAGLRGEVCARSSSNRDRQHLITLVASRDETWSVFEGNEVHMRLKRAIIVGVATACALAAGGFTVANAATRPSTITVTGARATFVGANGTPLPEYWAEVTITVRRGRVVGISSIASVCPVTGCVQGNSMWDNAALDLDAQANRSLPRPARQLVEQLSYGATYLSQLTQGSVFDAGFLAMYKESLRAASGRAQVRR